MSLRPLPFLGPPWSRCLRLAALALAIAGCSEAPAGAGGSAGAVEDGAGAAAAPAAAGQLFVDATDEWGVDFVHDPGAAGDLRFPEMMGGGVAIFDADGDGDLDLYFVNGAPQPGRAAAGPPPVNRLYLQGGDGRFADATAGSGLDDAGYGTGVAVGDFDNDGRDDVFVSNVGQDRLFRSQGDGSFEDVTRPAGIPGGGDPHAEWSTSAAFCDVDRDGFLDLYVVRYVVYDDRVTCSDKAGRREYCGPDNFPDQTDRLLRNQGDGTFRDVTHAAGIDRVTGAGLGVVCDDLDGDGWPDVYVANDGDPNQLWINQRDGTFRDDAVVLGAAVNAAGLHEAGMGVVAADLDGDLDLDLFLTHLRDETNTFYRNLGPGAGFADESTAIGLAAGSTPFTGFGTVPVDLDLDGDLDLPIVDGRVLRGSPLTDALGEPWNDYAEPNLVYLNEGGRFRRVSEPVRAFVEPVEVGRGLATGDLDGDGDLDLVLTNIAGPARLYRAEPPPGHWLLVDAVDPALGGRRALGARVRVEVGGRTWVRTVQGAMSYLSASDPRAHFGLGPRGSLASGTAAVSVRWPDGGEESFGEVAIDRLVVLRRGEGEGGS
ncbi:MAG TPA: CRTAC1 family protein [Thermoanaerobaculia bacterium]